MAGIARPRLPQPRRLTLARLELRTKSVGPRRTGSRHGNFSRTHWSLGLTRTRSSGPKFSFVLDVRDPPEKVIGAMIDFSDRRPEIWPNLSTTIYRAHSVGENTADVTEGTDVPGGGVWERVTYEWTDTTVKSVITDSKLFQAGGRIELRVEPHGSGSRIHFSIDRKAKTLVGRLVGALMQVSNGAPMKKSCYAVYGKPT